MELLQSSQVAFEMTPATRHNRPSSTFLQSGRSLRCLGAIFLRLLCLEQSHHGETFPCATCHHQTIGFFRTVIDRCQAFERIQVNRNGSNNGYNSYNSCFWFLLSKTHGFTARNISAELQLHASSERILRSRSCHPGSVVGFGLMMSRSMGHLI